MAAGAVRNTDLILRSRALRAASRRMAATQGLAAIRRDARKGALLRMRPELVESR